MKPINLQPCSFACSMLFLFLLFCWVLRLPPDRSDIAHVGGSCYSCPGYYEDPERGCLDKFVTFCKICIKKKPINLQHLSYTFACSVWVLFLLFRRVLCHGEERQRLAVVHGVWVPPAHPDIAHVGGSCYSRPGY